jgi:hypothetical protein
MREEILRDVLQVAENIEHFPSRDEYILLGHFTKRHIEEYFGSYLNLKQEFFLKPFKKSQEDKIVSDENQEEIIQEDIQDIKEKHFKFLKEETENGLNLVSTSYEIRTVEDLLEYSSTDLNDFEIVKKVVNSWGSPENPCYQVKVWLRKKTPEQVNVKQLVKAFEEEVSKYAIDYSKIIKGTLNKKKKKDSCLYEISLQDVHFGQLSWAKETGHDNYDIVIAEKLMLDAVDYFIEQAKFFSIDEILFPVGSDFFNVNSSLNTTVAGTSQDEDCRWQKSFYHGCMLLVKCIDKLLKITNRISVPIVYGNHDHERTYYAGSYLSAWYRNHNKISIDNNPRIRKYIKYHKNLIGLTHGHELKLDRLPLLMATEAKDIWGDTLFREWHIGHLHHKNTKVYNVDIEENGVRVKIIPSLVAVDAWHSLKGYNALRECQSFLWDKEKGNIAQFNYKV